MSRPTVTIVTPSYNQGEFIEWTIRSVLCQDYPDIEYIVYDAVSTDSTPAVLRRYARYIDQVVIEKDKGQTDALNRAFARSSGQIMAYLNSDDVYLHPSVVSRAVQVLLENPGVDVVYGNRECMDGEGRFAYSCPTRPYDPKHFVRTGTIPQESAFWTRSIYDRAGGFMNTDYHFSMDFELFLRFYEAGAKFLAVPERWGLFRLSANHKSALQWKTVGVPENERLLRPYRPPGYVFAEDDLYQAYHEYLYGAAPPTNPAAYQTAHSFWMMVYELKKKQYEQDRLDAWVAHAAIHPARGCRRAS